jgi:hypothetical protein
MKQQSSNFDDRQTSLATAKGGHDESFFMLDWW